MAVPYARPAAAPSRRPGEEAQLAGPRRWQQRREAAEESRRRSRAGSGRQTGECLSAGALALGGPAPHRALRPQLLGQHPLAAAPGRFQPGICLEKACVRFSARVPAPRPCRLAGESPRRDEAESRPCCPPLGRSQV